MSIRRMMLFSLGAKIKNIIEAFKSRVFNQQGQFEADTCLNTTLRSLNTKELLDNASLVVTPNAYSETRLYNVVPSDGKNILLQTQDFENASWLKQGGSETIVLPNVEIAPDGTLTGDKIYPNTSSTVRGVFQVNFPVNTYRYSVYAKKGGKDFLYFYVIGSTASTGCWFNLDTGTVGTVGSSWSNAIIENVGSGWYRCSATVTITNSTNNIYYFVSDTNNSLNVTANGTDGIFLWGAQLELGTVATDYQRNTTTRGGFQVTRTTTATRVNEVGEVELVPYNLLRRSEEFENSFWNKQRTSITQNVIMAPNNTMTADSLVGVSGNTYAFTGALGVNVVSNSFVTRNECTVFFYLKYNGLNRIRVMYGEATTMSGGRYVEVDLQLGIITDIGVDITNPFIEDVGDGWYRVGFTSNMNVSTTNNRFGVGLGDTVKTIADGVDGVYIWGAQLVDGDLTKEYLPVSTGFDIPRIDYSNGSCPSILVEPQRTNLISHSSNVGVSPWNALGTEVLLFPNEAIAPDGTMTAARYLTNEGLGRSRYMVSITSGVTYTVSFWAKNISMTKGNSTITGVGAPSVNYIPLINTETWTRITYTFTATETAFNNFRLIQYGNIDGEILLWGPQLEQGSNATSYIPTTTAAVTRNADVIRRTDAQDLIGQTEGTIFLDFYYGSSAIDNLIFIQNSLTNYLFRARIGPTGDNNFNVAYFNSSAGMTGAGVFTSSVALIPNTRNKIVVTYNGVTQRTRLFLNGLFISETLVTTAFPTNQNIIDIGITFFQTIKEINNVSLWKTQITDAQAIQLTTL